jgi:tRNA threonylcarbamoyladenosine biosynthesis protein TsaB
MILTIRTDKPEAEIGLYDLDGQERTYMTWLAHRELSNTLLSTIHEQLGRLKKDFTDLTGIVVFQGPGSFTGLRIGITVANAFAYGRQIPIVGEMGDGWIKVGLSRLADRQNDTQVLPVYGSDAHITTPKK